MKVRKLNNEELKEIKTQLNNYIDLSIFNFDNLLILIDNNNKINVIYTTNEVINNIDKLININCIGIIFGELELKQNNKLKFTISLEGLSILEKNISKNYIIINSKSETLFLYGRDIFKSSVIKLNGGGKVAVFNENKELLGIGNYGGGDIIKNIIDKGWYLRKGG